MKTHQSAMIQKIIAILMLSILWSCAQETSDVVISGSASGGDTRWNTGSLPVTIAISDSFSSEETTAVADMATEWNTGIGSELTLFGSTTTTSNLDTTNLDTYNDSVLGVYSISTWSSELPSSALAVAQIYGVQAVGDDGQTYVQIQHADILVNEDGYSFSRDGSAGTYDFDTVILHELGHLVGLSHTSFDEDSVMQPSISTSDEKRSLFTVDVSNIQANYGLTSSALITRSSALSEQGNQIAAVGAAREVGQQVRIRIELMAEGHCRHVVDDQMVYEHPTNVLHSDSPANIAATVATTVD